MVYDYAMGTPATAQRAIPEGNSDSEQFRRVRDEEQHELAFEAQRAATELLTANRSKLNEFAAELLENEVLDRDEIDRIMRGVPRMQRHAGRGLRVVVTAADGGPIDDGGPRGPRTSEPPQSA